MKSCIILLLAVLLNINSIAQVRSMIFKNEKRAFIVYTPQSYQTNKDKKYPVVYNFHGGGMTMAEQMLYTKMNSTADKHDFIVVYPQGIKKDWNVGFGMSYKYGTDDIGFVDSLLNYINKNYRTDTRKTFATGLSRGGFFCQRLATELPGRFAAVASVGATMPDSVAYYNPQKGKTGILLVHGTADSIVYFNGKPGHYFSAANTYDFWLKQNEITATASPGKNINKNKTDGTSITVVESQGGGKYVSLMTVNGGGHTWVGANPFNIGLPIGATSADLDLNEYIWMFFMKNTQ
jgi:polyhydroxybutyrate depolymerase